MYVDCRVKWLSILLWSIVWRARLKQVDDDDDDDDEHSDNWVDEEEDRVMWDVNWMCLVIVDKQVFYPVRCTGGKYFL